MSAVSASCRAGPALPDIDGRLYSAVVHQTPQLNQAWTSPRLLYDRRYNIGLLGLERLHPFDSRKYGRAWRLLRRQFGRRLSDFHDKPQRPVTHEDLLQVHTQEYLQRLQDPAIVARVLELPQLRLLPSTLIDWAVLRPMRWAVAGTVAAARAALDHGLAVNLGGGYHHAGPGDGHGFSAYADVGLAISQLRREGRLRERERIAYVDLDAHQGNGVCRLFATDRRVFIYDQYNCQIFPGDLRAQRRIDCDVPVQYGCRDTEYLEALRSRLPPFLDSILAGNPIALGIYNAGTDVYTGDQLGGLNLSAAGVLDRDRYVLQELLARRIPTMVALSGGYSRESYRMVAAMVAYVIDTWGR